RLARRLRAALADEVLGDGGAVAFVGDHDPGDQVQQDASATEDGEQGERQAYQGRVDAEVARDTGAHPRDDTPLAGPVQALAWIDVWLSHSSIMPPSGPGSHRGHPG